jgi:protein-S-isoprenylcysteine O-methyltransferase Ste14
MISAFTGTLILWAAFLAAFAVSHVATRGQRAPGEPPEKRIHRNPAGRWGGLLQFLGIVAVFALRDPDPAPGVGRTFVAYGLAGVSLGLTWSAVRHLGKQWRLAAVVAEDHRLITSGPYSVLRHPIYTAWFGLTVATALLIGRWPHAAAGLVVFLAGTEIRTRAEEKVLRRAFPEDYPDYARRVRSYLPWVR